VLSFYKIYKPKRLNTHHYPPGFREPQGDELLGD